MVLVFYIWFVKCALVHNMQNQCKRFGLTLKTKIIVDEIYQPLISHSAQIVFFYLFINGKGMRLDNIRSI